MNTVSAGRGGRMFRVLLGLAATATAAAGPPPTTHGLDAAMARDPALRRCRDLLEPLSPGASPPGPTAVEAAGPDECRFRNIRLSLSSFVGYRVDTLLVRGIPFNRPPGPLPHVHARVEARGITLSIRDQPAKLAWMSQQQQVPFDLTLDAVYDPAVTSLVLNEFSMDGEALGHAGLRARFENVHLVTTRSDDVPEMQALPGLKSLHVELDSRTFLASYVLPLIVNLLPDDDPDGAFQAGRAKVVAAIDALLPASGASTDTTGAVTGLVADFPRPKHPAVLDIEANAPITPDAVRAAIEDPARLPALLRALNLTASYAGTIR